jgi:hypothetical protein
LQGRIAPPLVLLAAGLVALGACRRPAATRLEAVCDGVSVVQRVTLSVDDVRPTAGVELHQIRGERYELVLTLLPEPHLGSCTDRSGEATWQGFLPDPLADATAGPATAAWSVSGTSVRVELNPRAADNNLSLSLPLSGGEGSWDLSTFVGTVASGKVRLGGKG